MCRWRRRLPSLWLPLAILSPGLIWLALDRAVWPWDQAWFGAHTVTLYETLRQRPFDWPAAMIHATPLKPPAPVWIGQIFVPLGAVFGSVDAALLLSIWITHAAAVFVVFRTLIGLFEGRTVAAAAGTLAAAAAPVCVVLSTQYFAEGSQLLAVAWFVFIMARSPGWERSKVAAHLLMAASFAMLAKTTSPVFFAVPALVTVGELLRRPPRAHAPAPSRERAHWLLWTAAISLALLAGGWYAVNYSSALLLARTAAFGPVAELYGRRETFIGGFLSWWMLATDAFFLRPVALALAQAGLVSAGKRLVRGAMTPANRQDVAPAAAVLQILVTLTVFAASPVREPRYLEALLPLVAVIVGWISAGSGMRVGRLVLLMLATQLALVQTQALGLWPARPRPLRAGTAFDPILHELHFDTTPGADAAAIVRRTCGAGAAGVYHLVGVDLLALSGHALTYTAAKERLAGRAGDCRYVSLGFSSVAAAEAEVKARRYVYWITADPDLRPVLAPHVPLNQTAPVIFRRLRRRGALAEEPWDGPPGIRLFRFVSR